MRCAHPAYVLDLGVKDNGKRNLKFLPRRVDLYDFKVLTERYGKDSILPLPCGRCLNCKINHAKEWAVRCVLESMYYENNYFITLTYDDAHLPKDGELHREHVQLFLKRLRNRLGSFRYFGCGEFGTSNHRPHYHLILFGINLADLKPVGSGLFESKVLTECWSYGFNYIGFVSYSSCNYVAMYSTKKVFGDRADREFIMTSIKPGIGYQWCVDHLPKVLEYDSVFGSFGSAKCARMPRYFEKIAEVLDKSSLDAVKNKRLDKDNSNEINKMLVHELDRIEKLLAYEEECTLNDFLAKKRGKRL